MPVLLEGKAVRSMEADVRRWAPGHRRARHALGEASAWSHARGQGENADSSKSVLTATENGFGKRTPIAEYTRHGRGGQGLIAIQTSERNGAPGGRRAGRRQRRGDALISTGGVLIRTRSRRSASRALHQGVTLTRSTGREARRPRAHRGARRRRGQRQRRQRRSSCGGQGNGTGRARRARRRAAAPRRSTKLSSAGSPVFINS